MSEPGGLVPLYLDSDRTRIRLVGGPRNCEVLTWASSEPPLRLDVAVERPKSGWFSNLEGPPLFPSFLRASYATMLDAVGYPSRADDGALLYECVAQ
ncbi:hypothetical protein ACWGQ5_47225 [Streptomyces sp. NPDC055722]